MKFSSSYSTVQPPPDDSLLIYSFSPQYTGPLLQQSRYRKYHQSNTLNPSIMIVLRSPGPPPTTNTTHSEHSTLANFQIFFFIFSVTQRIETKISLNTFKFSVYLWIYLSLSYHQYWVNLTVTPSLTKCTKGFLQTIRDLPLQCNRKLSHTGPLTAIFALHQLVALHS